MIVVEFQTDDLRWHKLANCRTEAEARKVAQRCCIYWRLRDASGRVLAGVER